VGKDNVLYADTDSLYFRKETPSVIEYAKNELQVTLEVAERWKILFLTNVAKNYFGMTEDGEVENTTLTGMKSNYPLIIREIAKKVVSKELLEQFITNPDTALASVLEYVRGGFKTLNETDPFELVITKLFQDDLWDHEINNEPIQLYKEILEDCNGDEKLAKSQSRGGEVYKYYKVKAKDRSVSRYVERYQLDMKTYRSYLFNAIKAQLEVYGMNKNELKKLEKELVK
jgi:DNA polymerase elongation subunit (family B)